MAHPTADARITSPQRNPRAGGDYRAVHLPGAWKAYRAWNRRGYTGAEVGIVKVDHAHLPTIMSPIEGMTAKRPKTRCNRLPYGQNQCSMHEVRTSDAPVALQNSRRLWNRPERITPSVNQTHEF